MVLVHIEMGDLSQAERQLFSKVSGNTAQSRAAATNDYFVIRLGEMGSLAGKVSSTASSTSFSWR